MTQPVSSALYAEYEIDTDLAENAGVWVAFKGDVEVRLRAESSTAARKWGHKRARALRSMIVANDHILPPKQSDLNDVELLADVLVTDWRNVTDRTGTPLPCTKENVKRIFTELPSFRRDVMSAVRMDETFKKQALEDVTGNSSPSSAPSSLLGDSSTPSL